MGGNYQTRENRVWLDSTQNNVAPFRFFWEYMNFIEDHTNMNVIAYGEGTSQLGTSLPTSWLAWDGIISPPMNNQAWFVFEASVASVYLNGNGDYKWQAKIQVVNDSTVLFSDCSGINYGLTTEDQLVAIRCSPHGGWAGPTTLDFVPSSGSDISDNYAMFYEDGIDFRVHFFGDDDMLHWEGIGGSPANYDIERGGYIGMVNRRDDQVDDPFIMMIGRIGDDAAATGRLAKFSKGISTTSQFYTITTEATASSGWPAYMLSRDGTTEVNNYKIDQDGDYWAKACGDYQYKTPNEKITWAMVVAMWETPNEYQELGELLYIYSTSGVLSEGTVFGEDLDFIELSNNTDGTARGGIAVKWPDGESPLW